MESGIRTQKSLESRIQELGIRNPGTWNPESRDSESGIRRLESGIHHTTGFPYMGRDSTIHRIRNLHPVDKISVYKFYAAVHLVDNFYPVAG